MLISCTTFVYDTDGTGLIFPIDFGGPHVGNLTAVRQDGLDWTAIIGTG